jgi:CRISPR-associated protein Cas1
VSVLVLAGERRVLGVRGRQLAALVEGEVVAVRAPEQLEEIHVYGDGVVSPAARDLCLRAGLDIVFLSPGGEYLGRLSSQSSPAGERRLAQLSLVLDPARRRRLAAEIVAGKIRNQEVHLQRVQRRAPHPDLADARVALRSAALRAGEMETLDQLRGTEGLAARLYFGALAHAPAPGTIPFSGRNRRPPRDPINAALSFAYTLLCSRVEWSVRAAGLDVHVGFLHEATRGQPACALDLAEEWRPLVDAMVFGLVNRRELGPEDVETPGVSLAEGPGGADGEEARPVYLNAVGREVLFRAWFRRLDEPVTLGSAAGRLPVRGALLWQAQHLARVCEGREPAYQPFRWT